MHELSIAKSIFDFVLKEKTLNNLPPIKAVGLQIGALSDILPDALEFSFDAIKKETDLEFTKLEISVIPLKGVCRDCNENFFIKSMVFSCPRCFSGSIKIDKGYEMDIVYFDIEDEKEIVFE